jgi:hypothetical protein
MRLTRSFRHRHPLEDYTPGILAKLFLNNECYAYITRIVFAVMFLYIYEWIPGRGAHYTCELLQSGLNFISTLPASILP